MADIQRNQRSSKRTWIIGLLTALACVNLAVLLFLPDTIAGFLRPDSGPIPGNDRVEGKGQACLTLTADHRTYNGEGIFDPLEGVSAKDVDGSDITDKIAVTFVSGKRIDEKTIRYMVFDQNGSRMEAACPLKLENYDGPSIQIEPLESIRWENLDALPRPLLEQGLLNGGDGFGNDISGRITCFYEIDPVSRIAEITFLLYNDIRDLCTTKLAVQVEDLPPEWQEL